MHKNFYSYQEVKKAILQKQKDEEIKEVFSKNALAGTCFKVNEEGRFVRIASYAKRGAYLSDTLEVYQQMRTVKELKGVFENIDTYHYNLENFIKLRAKGERCLEKGKVL